MKSGSARGLELKNRQLKKKSLFTFVGRNYFGHPKTGNKLAPSPGYLEAAGRESTFRLPCEISIFILQIMFQLLQMDPSGPKAHHYQHVIREVEVQI